MSAAVSDLFPAVQFRWLKIQESHENLRVNGENRIRCCYVRAEDHPSFTRRLYWLIDRPDVVLAHYRDDNPAEARRLQNAHQLSETISGVLRGVLLASGELPVTSSFSATGDEPDAEHTNRVATEAALAAAAAAADVDPGERARVIAQLLSALPGVMGQSGDEEASSAEPAAEGVRTVANEHDSDDTGAAAAPSGSVSPHGNTTLVGDSTNDDNEERVDACERVPLPDSMQKLGGVTKFVLAGWKSSPVVENRLHSIAPMIMTVLDAYCQDPESVGSDLMSSAGPLPLVSQAEANESFGFTPRFTQLFNRTASSVFADGGMMNDLLQPARGGAAASAAKKQSSAVAATNARTSGATTSGLERGIPPTVWEPMSFLIATGLKALLATRAETHEAPTAALSLPDAGASPHDTNQSSAAPPHTNAPVLLHSVVGDQPVVAPPPPRVRRGGRPAAPLAPGEIQYDGAPVPYSRAMDLFASEAPGGQRVDGAQRDQFLEFSTNMVTRFLRQRPNVTVRGENASCDTASAGAKRTATTAELEISASKRQDTGSETALPMLRTFPRQIWPDSPVIQGPQYPYYNSAPFGNDTGRMTVRWHEEAVHGMAAALASPPITVKQERVDAAEVQHPSLQRHGTALGIVDFSPEWDVTRGGSKMLVTCANLRPGSYGVRFGTTLVGAEVLHAGLLRCRVPPCERGVVQLRVSRTDPMTAGSSSSGISGGLSAASVLEESEPVLFEYR